MKIGIITLALHTNYGGIMQAYAMQKVMQQLGHDTCIIDQQKEFKVTYRKRVKSFIKFIIKRILKGIESPIYTEKYMRMVWETRTKNTGYFIDKYIKRKIVENVSQITKDDYDGFIIGSDQIWRVAYSKWFPSVENSFLEFTKDWNVKRIAYAASFGVSNWEYSDEETAKCAELAKQFNAISVREDSGVALCKKYLGVEAEHLLDPTMLLEKSEYEQLANNEKEEAIDGDLFCYILDSNEEKTDIRNNFEKTLHYKSFEVKATKSGLINKHSDLSEYIVPSPTKWIRAFMDAKMVLTDSFHGCVFSIIFNKPFWVIENRERGNARFDSLLKLFNLEHRRIDTNNLEKTDLSTPIDWQQVNTIRDEWKKKSIDFLVKSL